MLNSLTLSAMSAVLEKLAEEERGEPQAPAAEVLPVKPKKPAHPALTAAKYLGAYGAGTGVGYGGMMLADAASKKYLGRPVSSELFHAVPLMTGAGGLAFTAAQNSLFSRMREDSKARKAHGRPES